MASPRFPRASDRFISPFAFVTILVERKHRKMYVAQPIEWTDRGVVMLDQRRLPAEEIHYTYTDYREVAKAIREMVIRGAPAIGVAAAMGVALGVLHSHATSVDPLKMEFREISRTLAETRPTAVDLFWALHRMKRASTNCSPPPPAFHRFATPSSPKPKKSTSKKRPPTRPSAVLARSSCPRMAKS